MSRQRITPGTRDPVAAAVAVAQVPVRHRHRDVSLGAAASRASAATTSTSSTATSLHSIGPAAFRHKQQNPYKDETTIIGGRDPIPLALQTKLNAVANLDGQVLQGEGSFVLANSALNELRIPAINQWVQQELRRYQRTLPDWRNLAAAQAAANGRYLEAAGLLSRMAVNECLKKIDELTPKSWLATTLNSIRNFDLSSHLSSLFCMTIAKDTGYWFFGKFIRAVCTVGELVLYGSTNMTRVTQALVGLGNGGTVTGAITQGVAESAFQYYNPELFFLLQVWPLALIPAVLLVYYKPAGPDTTSNAFKRSTLGQRLMFAQLLELNQNSTSVSPFNDESEAYILLSYPPSKSLANLAKLIDDIRDAWWGDVTDKKYPLYTKGEKTINMTLSQNLIVFGTVRPTGFAQFVHAKYGNRHIDGKTQLSLLKTGQPVVMDDEIPSDIIDAVANILLTVYKATADLDCLTMLKQHYKAASSPSDYLVAFADTAKLDTVLTALNATSYASAFILSVYETTTAYRLLPEAERTTYITRRCKLIAARFPTEDNPDLHNKGNAILRQKGWGVKVSKIPFTASEYIQTGNRDLLAEITDVNSWQDVNLTDLWCTVDEFSFVHKCMQEYATQCNRKFDNETVWDILRVSSETPARKRQTDSIACSNIETPQYVYSVSMCTPSQLAMKRCLAAHGTQFWRDAAEHYFPTETSYWTTHFTEIIHPLIDCSSVAVIALILPMLPAELINTLLQRAVERANLPVVMCVVVTCEQAAFLNWADIAGVITSNDAQTHSIYDYLYRHKLIVPAMLRTETVRTHLKPASVDIDTARMTQVEKQLSTLRVADYEELIPTLPFTLWYYYSHYFCRFAADIVRRQEGQPPRRLLPSWGSGDKLNMVTKCATCLIAAGWPIVLVLFQEMSQYKPLILYLQNTKVLSEIVLPTVYPCSFSGCSRVTLVENTRCTVHFNTVHDLDAKGPKRILWCTHTKDELRDHLQAYQMVKFTDAQINMVLSLIKLEFTCEETMDSLVGMENEKEIMRDSFINCFTPICEDKIQDQQLRDWIMIGKPGAGKTSILKAAILETPTVVFEFKAASIISHEYGGTQKNLMALTVSALFMAPCVILCDEIDTLLTNRLKSQQSSDASKEENRNVSVIDTFYDDLNELKLPNKQAVFMFGSSNRKKDEFGNDITSRFNFHTIPDPSEASIVLLLQGKYDQYKRNNTKNYINGDKLDKEFKSLFIRLASHIIRASEDTDKDNRYVTTRFDRAVCKTNSVSNTEWVSIRLELESKVVHIPAVDNDLIVTGFPKEQIEPTLGSKLGKTATYRWLRPMDLKNAFNVK